jgi:hypothetical protein
LSVFIKFTASGFSSLSFRAKARNLLIVFFGMLTKNSRNRLVDCVRHDTRPLQCLINRHRPNRLRQHPCLLLNRCRPILCPFRRWEGENLILAGEIKIVGPVRRALPRPLRCGRRL